MEDAELVLKELRIDWETVLTEEYNPLKQALEIKRNSLKLSNYRNIYHKVERIMEKIIEETYKGFSDSVLSYTECYNLTTKGLKDLNQMQKIIDNTASMKINTKDIYGNYQETEHLRIKNEICEDLVNLKEKYDSFKSFYKENKIQQAVHDLQEVRDLIKIKNLYNIKGIDTFGLEVEGDVKEVCEEIFSKLDLFIYKNQIEFKDYFRLIIVLNRILKYDRFVYANLEKNVFRSIEGIIHGINKKDGECSEGDDVSKDSDGECSEGDDGSKDSDADMDDKCIDNNVDNNKTNVHNTHNNNTQLPLLSNGTKIIFTLKSQNKISCFYNGKPKFKSNRNLKSLLVKLIVDKIKMIKYNLNFLRQMTDNAFSQLNEEEKNYYAEYKGFMIFCDKGKENTNLIIQKVINTFIDVYTSSDKKDIEIGEFENINILDDINYEEEFDEKYSIYKRIQNKNEGNEGKEDNFTLIFKPNIDICLDLYEFFREEPIKQRCLKFINFRSEEVYKRVILIFQEHKWDRNNFFNSNLWFTNSFLKILKEEEGILRVFGAISLKKSFEIVKRKMREKFDFYFNSEIFGFFLKEILNEIIIFTDKKDLNLIDWSNQEKQTSNTQFFINLKNLKGLETTDIFKFSNFVKIEQKSNFKFFIKFSEEVKTELKTYVISNFINNKELLNSKSKYDHILFSINSLIELSLIEMAYQYAFSLKINLFLEIFFYLDVWYREGIYDNLVYIMKIIKIIQETYKNLDLSDLFEIINFYLIKNKKRLNVKNKKDLESFIKGIKILDECLSDVNEKKNLKRSIEYYCCAYNCEGM